MQNMKTDPSSLLAATPPPGSSSLPVKPKTLYNQQDLRALHAEAKQIAATWSGLPATEGKGIDAVAVSGKYQPMLGEDPGCGTLFAILTNQLLGFKAKQPEMLQYVLSRMGALHPELTLKYWVRPDRRPPQRTQYDYTVTSATKVLAETDVYCGSTLFCREGYLLGWVFSYSDRPGYYRSFGHKRTPHNIFTRKFDTAEEATAHTWESYRRFVEENVSIV